MSLLRNCQVLYNIGVSWMILGHAGMILFGAIRNNLSKVAVVAHSTSHIPQGMSRLALYLNGLLVETLLAGLRDKPHLKILLVRRPDNLTTFMCRLSWGLRSLTSLKSQGLSRPINGIALPIPLPNVYIVIFNVCWKNILVWNCKQ